MRKLMVVAFAFAVLLLVPVVGGVSAAENNEQYNALCDPASPHYGGYGNEPSTLCVASFAGKLAEKNLTLKALAARVQQLENQTEAKNAAIAKLTEENGELKSANKFLGNDKDALADALVAAWQEKASLKAQLERSKTNVKLVSFASFVAIILTALCIAFYANGMRARNHNLRASRDATRDEVKKLRGDVENLNTNGAELARIASEQIAEKTRQADEHGVQVSELSKMLRGAEAELARTRYQGLALEPTTRSALKVYDAEKPERPGVVVDLVCPGEGKHGPTKIKLNNLRSHLETLHWKDQPPAVVGEVPAAPDVVVDEFPLDEPQGGEA